MQDLGRRAACILALSAFLLAVVVGLGAGVSLTSVATRAMIGAMVSFVFGLMFGPLVIHSVNLALADGDDDAVEHDQAEPKPTAPREEPAAGAPDVPEAAGSKQPAESAV